MPGRVFISYSSVDREQVQALVKALDDVPIPYFLDEKEIQWGDDITEKIGRGLAECFALIVVLSPASVKSQWVPFEVGQKEAEKQPRPLSASMAGLACLAVGHPHNPHVVFRLLSRRFKAGRYPGLSGVELIRTATHLAPPVRAVIDLLAFSEVLALGQPGVQVLMPDVQFLTPEMLL